VNAVRLTRSSSPHARFRLRSGLLACVLTLGLLTPSAALAGGSAVIKDCATDGKLDKKYPAADYANALKNIPTDVDEYTDCRDVIKRGQLGLGGGGSGSSDGSGGAGGATGTGGGTGGGTDGSAGAAPGNGLNAYDQALSTATPEERASVDKAAKLPTGPLEVGGRRLRPDSLSHGDLASLNTLPTPLVIVLVLLGAAALAAAFSPVRSFVRTRVQRTA
jgi:hypothetical protein